MKTIRNKFISALLALTMVFLLIPFSIINITAEGAGFEEIKSSDDMGLLGLSYNMLGDKSVGKASLSKIFNNANLLSVLSTNGMGLPISTIESKTNYSYEFVENLSSYLRTESDKMSIEIGANAKIKMVTIEAKVGLGATSSFETSGNSETEYAVIKVSHIIGHKSLSLTDGAIKTLYGTNNQNSVFTAGFLDEISKISDPTSIATFIAAYGTHIVVGYAEGGEAVMTYSSQNLSSTSAYEETKSFDESAGVNAANIVDVNQKYSSEKANSDKNTQGSITIGYVGNSFGSTNILDVNGAPGNFDASAVQSFVDGVSPSISDIVIDEHLKLLPIWELLEATGDEKLKNAANLIEAYYNKEIVNDCAEFYDEYLGETYIPAIDAETAKEVEEWSKLDPESVKIITTAEELASIGKEGGLPHDGIYVLANNIDLSAYENWSPIGESGSDRPFTGKFYGNYNTISGLKITEANSYGYAGLFGYVGESALISNLKVNGEISVAANADKYIGGIAAYTRGTVKNCYDGVTYNVSYTNVNDLNIPVRNIDLMSGMSTIVIGDEVGVRLVGGEGQQFTGINIEIADNGVKTPAYIILENASFVGSSSNGTIYNKGDRPIYIISTGSSNKISGAKNAVAINAANADLSIFGDAELNVVGGSAAGSATSEGASGKSGVPGTVCKSFYVDAGAVNIIGGAGESGAAGRNQSIGTAEAAPPGTTTTAGGSGGNGGFSIQASSVTINNYSNVTFVGGNGGKGGNGGYVVGSGSYNGYADLPDGANGGNGGDGGLPIKVNVPISISENARLKLQYGDGGDGGNGGSGGNAGWLTGVKPDGFGHGGNGGNGGAGYNGGNGGIGGDGGLSFSNYKSNGIFSNTNQIGTTGNGGIGGIGGNTLSALIYENTSIENQFGVVGKGGRGGACGASLGTSIGIDPHFGVNRYYITEANGKQDNHRYQLIKESLTWEAAKAACEALGGHLITVTSAEENKLAASLAGGSPVWLGASDTAVEGSFVWVTGEEFSYSNWNTGEPNNDGDQDYIQLVDGSGKWDDIYSTTTRYYICEWDEAYSLDFLPSEGRKNILAGISAGTYNGKVENVNNESWDDVILEIASPLENNRYYSGDSFNPSSVKITAHGSESSDYKYSFNSYCSSYEATRIGYVYISRDNCERYIPVYITKTVVSELEIERPGTQEFIVATEFNAQGLALKLIYNNGKTEIAELGDPRISYTAPDMSLPGEKTVAVTYRDESGAAFTASYTVNVGMATPVEIKVISAKSIYKQGNTLSKEGLVVQVIMNNGTGRVVDNSGLTLDVYPALCTVGTSTVTVTYDESLTASYEISVVANPDFEHPWDAGTVSRSATHIEEGEMLYTCSAAHCGATKTESIPKLTGHTYGEWISVDEMSHKQVCVCGEELVLPHKWDDGNVSVSPTHTQEGEKLYVCLSCNASKTEEMAKTEEHSFADEWSEYDEETHAKSCECGEVEYENHSFSDGVESLAPTYTEEGTMTYTCTACGYTKTQVIPEIGIENAPTIVIENAVAVIGQSVTVKIMLKNNPGIASMKFKLSYDTSVLTLNDITYNSTIGGQAQQPQNYNSPVILNWLNATANSEGDFLFATLTFAVNPEAAAGNVTEISLTYDENDVYDITETNIEFFTSGGALTLLDYKPGDMNGDLETNNKDLTRLFQYLSGWDVEANEKALDINGDGVVNNKDLTRLAQYLAGWDVEIN